MKKLQGRGRGRPQKYDWKTITNGRRQLATRGTDFSCQPDSFAACLRKHGEKIGRKPVIVITGDQVEYQFPRKRV